MKIVVNGEPREVEALHLEAVLMELGYGDGRVATALNGEFVPKPLRATTTLGDNDRLEVLAPMQGG
ncbi:sulfur carrier protein ThiS [Pelagibacterium halotolerans]|uniref:sulfur carrier protein ThiS n=1 Tax=Pelagibacterium halotolerans TaxID=531813 RepID=UPI003850B32E